MLLCNGLPVMVQNQTCGKLKTQVAPLSSVAFQYSECCKNILDGCQILECQWVGTSAEKKEIEN